MGDRRSKGEVEANVRHAVIKFEQEFMGRGPSDVRVLIARDVVLVRLKGVLTPAERQLAKSAEGVEMVKRMRQNLIAQGRTSLTSEVAAITGVNVCAVFTDIDVQLGERVLIFTMERDLEAEFQ